MKLLSFTLAVILFLGTSSVAGEGASFQTSQEIPKTATVEIILLAAPGIDEQGSSWEIAYEFCIANQAALYEAWKQGKFADGGQERVGELIKESNIKKMLLSPENRKISFQIPLSPEIQERLRNEPRDQLKMTPGKPTSEERSLIREREMKLQSFLFRSVLNVYDAKLKQTLMIPARFHWSFGNYPEARFQINVEIKSDGKYSVNTSLPTKTRLN
ncbi:MAG TPA: hypothetical protein VLL54_16920 [Pyrinomonadaceae bacterium]|nr:hypothetical protein [Pyrinomonadaceae bacterium]